MINQIIKRIRPKVYGTVFWGLLLLGSQVQAAEISGVRFAEMHKDQGIPMRLQGTGLKTMLFFKAFVAGYYANEMDHANPLGEFPKRIEVEYFVNIPGKKLNNYTIEQMKGNISNEEFEHIKDEIQLMGRYFVDLKPGDRFALTYIPGVGTKFTHNNQLVGVIKGQEFAKALFSVWIGEKPFDMRLKEQVLGLNQMKNQNVEADRHV